MAFGDNDPFFRRVNADPAAIQPHGDCVLVQPIEDPTAPAPLIVESETKMTSDGRWRWDRKRGNQYGRVVAVGPGDRLLVMYCNACWQKGISSFTSRLETAKSRTCQNCGGVLTLGADKDGSALVDRAEMYVKPGDVVIFPRVPANEMEIGGESFVWLRQEQHVLAVLEEVAV